MYDNMADLYSIIKTTEALEKAYVRDAITADEYVHMCTTLEYKTEHIVHVCGCIHTTLPEFYCTPRSQLHRHGE
jgi:hypothetical protein